MYCDVLSVARTPYKNLKTGKKIHIEAVLLLAKIQIQGEFLRHFKTQPGMGKGQHLQFVQLGLITNYSASKTCIFLAY